MPQQQFEDDDDLSEFVKSLEMETSAPAPPPPPATDHFDASDRGSMALEQPAPPPGSLDGDDDLSAFKEDQKDSGLVKPWMKFHKFTLVRTVDEVKELVDRAIAHGRCGLDLETEGFDNRVNYVPEIHTVHKIVGFCISVKGHGHYIPVRHQYNTVLNEKNPNVSVAEVEAEIRRLCQASQPVLTPEGMQEDPLASTKIAEPSKVLIYFWNAKFDQEFLYPITGVEYWHPDSFEDGMLAAYTIYSDDPNLGLKEKARQRLTLNDPDQGTEGSTGKAVPYEMIEFAQLFPSGVLSKDRKFYDLVPRDGSEVVLYACSDAICTELLCERKKDVQWDLTREGLKYEYKNVVEPANHPRFSFTYRLEKQTAQATRDVERKRAKIDKKEIAILLEKAKIELAKYDDLIRALAGKHGFVNFNPGSPQQLSNFLFEKAGLDISPKPKKNEASGFYKTDAATLELMAETHESAPILGWIVKYRQIEKIIGTYLQSMQDNCDEYDQLRFKYNQTGATTGRFTAPAGEPDHGYSGIPIQGIPARYDKKKPEVAQALRRIFVAREGYTLVKVDYAGQELRIVANLSGESVWIDEFLHGDGDLHTITAKAFFGDHVTKEHKIERNAGKIANFSLIYGGGSQAIMRATKCDKVEAIRRKANFDKSVPTFAAWVKGQHAAVKKNLGVTTAFKRFIGIPDANLKAGELDAQGNQVAMEDARRIQASCERKSTNFPIQGSGADIMKISLVKLVKEFHKRGWRREGGGDDSVRMIMTVHDEIVFEIKHERLMEAVPIIIDIMESPSRMVRWKVPLVVEPLLGQTWEAKYDWHKIMHGKEPVPDWLQGILIPDKVHEPEAEKSAATATAPVTTAAAAQASTTEEPKAPEAAARTPSTPPPSPVMKGTIRVAVFALGNTYLTSRLVDVVFESVAGSLDPNNQTFLRLIDNGGNILIDPLKQRIPVNPEKLRTRFQDRNLGAGEFELKEEPL
jgi:DNA polymerase I-like protein with 3'-5' exonuclease and polymerase domains